MEDLPKIVPYAVPFFMAFVLAEMTLWRLTGRVRYETRDAAASLLLGIGNLLVGISFGFIGAGAVAAVHERRLLELGYAPAAFLACFLAEDLAYYWFHRTSHRRRWFWANHVVHHSSQHYNLTTALRQSWTGPFALTFLFWLPLAWVGFEPAMIAFFQGVSLVYQFGIHTEAVGKLGPLEWVFNTPSHHRVHHAVNPRYLDANYAGVLIIWDRLFGTFVAEDAADPPRYGIRKNLGTFNPLRAAFHEWGSLATDLRRARSLRERWGYLWQPPGWRPDGLGVTTEAIRAEWLARSARAEPASAPSASEPLPTPPS